MARPSRVIRTLNDGDWVLILNNEDAGGNIENDLEGEEDPGPHPPLAPPSAEPAARIVEPSIDHSDPPSITTEDQLVPSIPMSPAAEENPVSNPPISSIEFIESSLSHGSSSQIGSDAVHHLSHRGDRGLIEAPTNVQGQNATVDGENILRHNHPIGQRLHLVLKRPQSDQYIGGISKYRREQGPNMASNITNPIPIGPMITGGTNPPSLSESHLSSSNSEFHPRDQMVANEAIGSDEDTDQSDQMETDESPDTSISSDQNSGSSISSDASSVSSTASNQQSVSSNSASIKKTSADNPQNFLSTSSIQQQVSIQSQRNANNESIQRATDSPFRSCPERSNSKASESNEFSLCKAVSAMRIDEFSKKLKRSISFLVQRPTGGSNRPKDLKGPGSKN